MRNRTSIILFTMLIFVLALSGCKLKNPPDDSGSNEIWSDPAGGVGAERKSIVVSLVELKEGAYVGRVSLYVPASLMNAEVVINDTRDGFTVEHSPDEGLMIIDLGAAPNWDQVDITFGSSKASLGTCTIRVKESVYPSGDCSW